MGERLSIIAGGGALVDEVAASAVRMGWQVQIIALSPRPTIDETTMLGGSLMDPSGIITAIRQFASSQLCLAGGVQLSDAARGNLLQALNPGGAKPGAATGDTALSRFIGALEAAAGARIVGAHQIAPEILAERGVIAGPEPSPQAHAGATAALERAAEAGMLDLGQALVAGGGRVLAVEDILGTDRLLDRVAEFTVLKLVGPETGLILAKAAKPDQSLLVDMPAIGPATIIKAAAAGIALIALEAGKTIILERQQALAAASSEGITVLGIARADG